MSTVLIDCRMAQWSGVGRYTHGLVRALAALPDLSLVLATASGEEAVLPQSERVRAVTAVHHPFSTRGMRELANLVEQAEPNVVHCLHFPTPSHLAVPLVVTLHDVTPLILPETMPSAVRRAAYRRLTSRAVRLAARLIVPSEATAADVARLFPTAAGKTTLIAEAADDFAAGEIGALPTGVGAAPYILTMGNTKPHKDVPTVLTAFEYIAETRPDLQMVLVGSEPPGYLDAHLSGGSRERARFTGRVNDAELRALYARATVFAFPSRYEGFGLPPLEAMSFGTPVVVAAAASLPEVVGDAALIFPPGDVQALADHVVRLLDHAELRQDLGHRGRAQAARFSWARTASETALVYADALADGR